jgi:hypothetical protein
MPRTNFTDAQKAEIYVRDKAMCAFSGANLWLLDSGACGYYLSDWADHVKPSSGGGASAIDNGICASGLYNYAKNDSPYPGVPLFSRGVPTQEFFLLQHQFTPADFERHGRFSKLDASDWSFNRAIWLLCLGLCWLSDAAKGQRRSRDNIYYAKAALKRISSWHLLVDKGCMPTLEKRGLVPRPLQEDQRLLLSIRSASSTDEVLSLMDELLPFHSANQEAFDRFIEQLYAPASRPRSDAAFLRSLKNNRFVTQIVRRRLLASGAVIAGKG